MSYSGSVVLKEEKKFNELAKFLHFYDYLPFEEDLALYLNNLEDLKKKCYYLSLGKGVVLHLYNSESPFALG
jgi:hypothetical protein